jgi:hypothetical protein
VRSFGFAPIVINAVNDTLVFVAISYKIVSNTAVGNGWRACVSSFFRADGLPILSKALLQGGQLYYLSFTFTFSLPRLDIYFFSATIGLSIVFAVMLIAPEVPAVYHSMLSVPNLALANAMACRVFRAVKLGFIKNHQSTHDGVAARSSSAPDGSGNELAFKRPTLHESRNLQVNVDITRTTDMKIHDDQISGKPTSLVAEGSDASYRV